MSIICRKHKLLFIMVPGTGCSVVGNVLINQLGGEWIPKRTIRNEQGKMLVSKKHNTLTDLIKHGVLSQEERQEYLVFATIRNPFDRFVTYYQRYSGKWHQAYFEYMERHKERERSNRTEKEMKEWEQRIQKDKKKQTLRKQLMQVGGFNTWIQFTVMRKLITSAHKEFAFPMLEGVDYVVKNESLEAGLNKILDKKNIKKQIKLPRKNITPNKKHFTSYYSRISRHLIELIMNKDLKRFGYAFESQNLVNNQVIQLNQ